FGVKWQIISKLPMLGYLPFLLSLCIAGILQVIWLRLQVPFRMAVLILLAQAAVTYAAMLGLSFTFHNLLGVKVEPIPALARREAAPTPQPAPRHATTPPALAFEKTDGKSAPSIGDYWRGLPERLKDLGHRLGGYVDQLKEACDPVVRHLPESFRVMLDAGGWW